jgi:hypothetical protein
MVATRDLFQCSACRLQTSPIAGTIFAATKLPLRLWFRAIYHLTQSKQGISSIELGRRLGVTQTSPFWNCTALRAIAIPNVCSWFVPRPGRLSKMRNQVCLLQLFREQRYVHPASVLHES